ncbi:PTS sugar transporter subunit IIA [Magnetospirillum molischianum]|uniref:Nitrogen regulatory protein (Modular protein) n=1 Tax=Magnetospirillum molischianum DSM 120 TaxID=1150626 RepID=H8FPF0_MAGML|nr:PTS sugar transporter subunit IIA [Magnetospirillum molischianum]CCG40238.1 Nitrogen regulatory protein (modular protein) [Magnetospirillum molischianum DSM 120]
MPVIHHSPLRMDAIQAWCPRCYRETEQTVEWVEGGATSTHWCNRCLSPREVSVQVVRKPAPSPVALAPRAVSPLWNGVGIITPHCIISNLGAGSKTGALSLLAKQAAALSGHDQKEIYRVLEARERLGSTGVGNGVAIPHARIAGLHHPYIVFARTVHPIHFDSVDEQPVDLMFLLLSPERDPALHLKALSRISRLLHDHDLCQKLRQTESRDGLCGLLIDAFSA